VGRGITSAPKYFHLQLDLADGLSFQSPMPVACGVLAATNVTNGKSTPWVLGREGQLPLEVQKSLGLLLGFQPLAWVSFRGEWMGVRRSLRIGGVVFLRAC